MYVQIKLFSGEVHNVHICNLKEVFGDRATAIDVQEDISIFLSIITGSLVDRDRVVIFKDGEEIDCTINCNYILNKSLLDVFIKDVKEEKSFENCRENRVLMLWE